MPQLVSKTCFRGANDWSELYFFIAGTILMISVVVRHVRIVTGQRMLPEKSMREVSGKRNGIRNLGRHEPPSGVEGQPSSLSANEPALYAPIGSSGPLE